MDMSSWILSKIFPDKAIEFNSLVRSLERSSEQTYLYAEIIDFLSAITAEELRVAVENSPDTSRLSSLQANYLAALVEQAAVEKSVKVPEWTKKITVLEQPYFGSELQSLRMYLLINSPAPFKKRNIFIDSAIGSRV